MPAVPSQCQAGHGLLHCHLQSEFKLTDMGPGPPAGPGPGPGTTGGLWPEAGPGPVRG